eukprot:3598059-Rhodomonas_salina.3
MQMQTCSEDNARLQEAVSELRSSGRSTNASKLAHEDEGSVSEQQQEQGEGAWLVVRDMEDRLSHLSE